MKPQTVSIILPTYNCAPLLKRAIESVRAQTWQDWELLTVDNCSSDDTEIVVRSFDDPRIRYFTTQNGGVIARSRNLALSAARGRWIAFLDADDWWAPRKLELSVSLLESGCDVVYHDLVLVGPRVRKFPRRRVSSRALRSPVFVDLIRNGNALPNSSVVMSRDLMDRVGPLSEDPVLIGAEDFEFWLRAARLTERFCRLPGSHGFYWQGSGNTSHPRRTCATLKELRSRLLRALQIESSPPWVSFALAKAHFQLGEAAEARRELEQIRADAPVLYRFKKLALQLQYALRRPGSGATHLGRGR